MTITCSFEHVPTLVGGLVIQGVQFHCHELPGGQWLITLTGGY